MFDSRFQGCTDQARRGGKDYLASRVDRLCDPLVCAKVIGAVKTAGLHLAGEGVFQMKPPHLMVVGPARIIGALGVDE